jgi:NCAIR mutase (PurE)-related protein
VNKDTLKRLLLDIQSGKRTVDEGLEALRGLPFEDIGDAMVDHHRAFRCGLPEVILGEGKTADQMIAIAQSMVEKEENILITRLEGGKAATLQKALPDLDYHARSRTATLLKRPIEQKGKGRILILTAGTSDIPVAEEAMITAQMMGNEVEMICDVGVAGIHRLFHHREKIANAQVVVVVAGMEGALPSVVGGMVNRPVIAVPTSAGYGASFGGIAALLAMLNSCAAGVTVVNIDNGFGAGVAASLINQPQEE